MKSEVFQIKDCNLSLISTGKIASSLIELKDILYTIDLKSLYYHFWGSRLQVSFAHPAYHNDFARWAHLSLNDSVLTERLAIIDPTEFPSLEELRREVIRVMEERLDELESIYWQKKEERFHFLYSIIIVYSTGIKVELPSDLKRIIPLLTPTSIFYHFIDAKHRTADGSDDFSCWLASFGKDYHPLIQKLKLIDPYFLSLNEIKSEITKLVNGSL